MTPPVDPPRFCGLLVCPHDGERTANLAGGDPVDIYLRCAVLSAASFRAAGHDYVLVTDDAERLAARAQYLGLVLPKLAELRFALDVPSGVAFRAAHFKLELLGCMGHGEFGDRVGLVDLDAVCLRPLPLPIACADSACGYDISPAMVGPLGTQTVRDALGRLLGTEAEPRWWGGEFVFGPAARLAELSGHIAAMWPRYLANLGTMPHEGDEMVLSAAFQALEKAGGPVVDGAAAGAITRYWSARTLHRPEPFAESETASILHLPADKDFLAANPSRNFDPAAFLAAYRGHLRRKIAARRWAGIGDRLLGRPRRYPPRL